MAPKKKNKEVELMALPAGVPEVIQVVCNNYFGHFVVRSKTVVDRQWQEHPVAKFASLCGKSHLAWRHNTSVAAVGAQAGLTLYDWLATNKLTNDVLDHLARNAKECEWERPKLPGEASRFVVSLKGYSKSGQGIANGHAKTTTEAAQAGTNKASNQSGGGVITAVRNVAVDRTPRTDNASRLLPTELHTPNIGIAQVRGDDTAMARAGHQPAGQAGSMPSGNRMCSPRRKQASLNVLSGPPSKASNAPSTPTARPYVQEALDGSRGQRCPSSLQAARSPAKAPAQGASRASQKQQQQQQQQQPEQGTPSAAPQQQQQKSPGQANGADEAQAPVTQHAPPVPSPTWANLPLQEVFDVSPLQMMQEALQEPAPAAVPAPLAVTAAPVAAAAAATIGGDKGPPPASEAGAQAAESPPPPPPLPQSSPQTDQAMAAAAAAAIGSAEPWRWATATTQSRPGSAEATSTAADAPPAARAAGTSPDAAAASVQPAAAVDRAVTVLDLKGALATVDGIVEDVQEHSTGESQDPSPQLAAVTVSSPLRQPAQPVSAPAKAAPSPARAQQPSKPARTSAPAVPGQSQNRVAEVEKCAQAPFAEPAPVQAPVGGVSQADAPKAAAASEGPPQQIKTGPAENAAEYQVATEAGKVAMQAADPALRTPTPPAGMNKPTSGDIDMEHSTAVARLGRLKRCSTTANLTTDVVGTFTKRFKAEAAAKKAAIADKVSAQRELAAIRAAMQTLECDRNSAIASAKAAKEGEASKEQQLAELQAQLAAAQESAAAHKKQATSARGDLFALKASTKKSEKALTEENAKLKGELAQAKSLNETIRSSSQHVRVQLEAAKKEAAKAQENAQEIAGKEVQEAKEKEEAAVKELEAAKQREAEIKRQLESAVKEAEEARKDLQEAKEKQAAATKELEASKLAAYKEKACTNAESSSLKAQLEAARKKEAEAKAQLDRLRKEADAAAATAADEAQQVKLAAAEEAQRLKGEVQNLQIQYQNTTNLHRETHAESLRLQTELADALRKEARMQADAADAIAKFNNKVQQAKRQEDIMKAQVTDLETKLGAANEAGQAAVNAKGILEEVAKQSRHEMAALRAEIAALRTRHEAELHEAQQALQRERAQLQATFEADVEAMREQIAKEMRAAVEKDLAAALEDSFDDDMEQEEEEHEEGAQDDGDQHSDAGAGAAQLTARAEAAAYAGMGGPVDNSPNKASTCSGQTCHDQPSSAEPSPHGTPQHPGGGNSRAPPPPPPPPQPQTNGIDPQPNHAQQAAGSSKECEASKDVSGAANGNGAAPGESASAHDHASNDSGSVVARAKAGQAAPVGSPGSGASKVRKRGRPVKVVKSSPASAGAICPLEAPAAKRQALSAGTGPSLTAHAKDAGMDVEQDAALLGALMRCKDARNAQARGSLVAEPVLTNYSLSEAVQHMRQMAVLLHSPN